MLGGLGVEEKSARQALARMAADGWIVAERAGRRVRWALTRRGRELLTEGAERIYSLRPRPRAWDGRWLVLIATVPGDRQRELRHQLRTGLTWPASAARCPACGSARTPPARPRPSRSSSGWGLDVAAFSFNGPYAGIGSERTLVEQAWHLGDLAAQYQEFIQEFAGLRPEPGDPGCWRRSGWCTSGGVPDGSTRGCRWSCCRRLDRDARGQRLQRPAPRLAPELQRHWDTLCAAEE